MPKERNGKQQTRDVRLYEIAEFCHFCYWAWNVCSN